jgi:hypothetical protein
LDTATVNPLSAKFNARAEPIVPKPKTPISAVAVMIAPSIACPQSGRWTRKVQANRLDLPFGGE